MELCDECNIYTKSRFYTEKVFRDILFFANFYSLAFSDFGVGIVAQPLQVASGAGALKNDLKLFCSIQPVYAIVAYFFCAVSFLAMTAISLDRYFALYLKARYRLVVTAKKFMIALSFMWSGSIIWAISRMWNHPFWLHEHHHYSIELPKNLLDSQDIEIKSRES